MERPADRATLPFDPASCENRILDSGMPAEHGMGIALMRRCVDELSFHFESGTLVRLLKHVKP